jgi:hypothetical protein
MARIRTTKPRQRLLPVILLLGSAALLYLAAIFFLGFPARQPAARSTPRRPASSKAPAANAATSSIALLPPLAPPATPTFVPTQTPKSIRVRVTYSGKDGLHLRDAPNRRDIAVLLRDSLLTVRGAARDEAGFRWWPAAIEPGWMAEGPRNPAQARWLAPMGTDSVDAGHEARVVYTGADGLNLRRAPDPASDKVATLMRGSSVTVVAGPRVVDGVRWWQVRVAPGWIAEGATDLSQPRWLAFMNQ